MQVMVVDDHPFYVEGLPNLLSTRGVHVADTAHDGLEVQDMAHKLLSDLLLMNVKMPRCNGLETTQRIKTDLPDIKIVMLIMSADDETLFEALKSEAAGYLLKNLEGRQFFSLLTEVMQGKMTLLPTLTTRQRKVLELVEQGQSNKEIARQLHVSEVTVKYHVSQILTRPNQNAISKL